MQRTWKHPSLCDLSITIKLALSFSLSHTTAAHLTQLTACNAPTVQHTPALSKLAFSTIVLFVNHTPTHADVFVPGTVLVIWLQSRVPRFYAIFFISIACIMVFPGLLKHTFKVFPFMLISHHKCSSSLYYNLFLLIFCAASHLRPDR